MRYAKIIIIFLWISSTLLVWWVYAAATVTAWTAGTNLSADKASNAISPAWTTLWQIRINEWANTDIPANLNSWTYILTIPTWWEFNTSAWTISYTAARDITNAGLDIASDTITIILKTDATANRRDRINLNSIQVRSTDWVTIPNAWNILRLSTNPWTFSIVWITNNSTNFWSLSQTVWALNKLEVIFPWQSRWWTGVWVTGYPSFVFPNLQFTITDFKAVDQFDHQLSSYAWSKTMTYWWVSTASGANIFTTTVSFTAWDATTTLNTTLKTPWQYELTVRNGTTVYGTSTQFTVLNWWYFIDAPTSISLPNIQATNSQSIVRSTSTIFSVEDQKWFSSWYYTTLQCDDLVAETNTIANTNIMLSGSTLTLITWDTNASVTTSLWNSMQSCNSAIAFIRRNSWGGWASIYSQYGATISIQVTIPAWQAVWDYTSTITYTLIEN